MYNTRMYKIIHFVSVVLQNYLHDEHLSVIFFFAKIPRDICELRIYILSLFFTR